MYDTLVERYHGSSFKNKNGSQWGRINCFDSLCVMLTVSHMWFVDSLLCAVCKLIKTMHYKHL